MKRILGSTVAAAVLLLAIAATASASAGSESIMNTINVPAFPPAPPYKQTYSGTYTATGTFDDAGSLSVQALFSAVPSPTVGIIETRTTYTSNDGHSMLVLRCSQGPKGTGSCAVISATGGFSGLFRSGTISAPSGMVPGLVTDTVVLGR